MAGIDGESESDWRKRWVKLNVGGTVFLTTRATLSRHPDSFLYRLCQEDSVLVVDRDEAGAYLIERNPNYFAPVLDFMRHGELITDAGMAEEGVLKEAEFFGLPDLVRLLDSRIKEKGRARLVELKMVEEWRLEEKFKLEQKLGLRRKLEKPVSWSVRAFENSENGCDLLDEIRKHINFKLQRGAELYRTFDVFKEGTIVIMKEPQ